MHVLPRQVSHSKRCSVAFNVKRSKSYVVLVVYRTNIQQVSEDVISWKIVSIRYDVTIIVIIVVT